MGRHPKDRTGVRSGKLTLIKRIGSKNRNSLWEAICECGALVTLGTNELGAKTNCGSINCGGIPRVYWFETVYRVYKKNAENRNYVFELTIEEVKQLVLDKCFYCGREPYKALKSILSNLDTTFVNGIDRFDNAIGYISGNCVSCCSECNLAKGTMTATQFIHMCKLITNNFQVR